MAGECGAITHSPVSGAIERPRLRDQAFDAEVDRVGFVVVPGAARSVLRALRRVHRRLVGSVPPGFESTLYSGDGELKSRVHGELLLALQPLIDELFTDHRPLLTNFVTKGRSEAGTMPPHQDWTFVDERKAASWNLWVPLIDVDHQNGAMSLLPGGHQVPFTIRGTDTDNPFRAIEAEASRLMVEVPMAAGDVLVHDHRVLHGSPPNRRRRARVVAGCALLGAGAQVIHHRRIGSGVVERYALEDRFFTEHTFGAAAFPDSAHLIETIEFDNPIFDEADLPSQAPS